MFEAFFKDVEGIEIIDTDSKKANEEQSPYNSEFVEMVFKSANSKKSVEVNPNDVCEV